jgi:phosphoribosyl-AMP cyclohydrolase
MCKARSDERAFLFGLILAATRRTSMAWKVRASVGLVAELEEGSDVAIDFGRSCSRSGEGVVPVVVQDVATKEALLVGHVNEAGLKQALEKSVATFWSLTRDSLWVKGETSGNVLELLEVRVNCEQNSLLYLVRLVRGGACHTKQKDGAYRRGCYYRRISGDRLEMTG